MTASGLRIVDIRGYPTSFPVAPENSVSLDIGRVPLAAGENRYARLEFNRLIEDGAVILQPRRLEEQSFPRRAGLDALRTGTGRLRAAAREAWDRRRARRGFLEKHPVTEGPGYV